MPSKISEFAATHNARMDAASAAGHSDINAMNAAIAQFQSAPGELTAEDKALLEQLKARGAAVAAALPADTATPPTPRFRGAALNKVPPVVAPVA